MCVLCSEHQLNCATLAGQYKAYGSPLQKWSGEQVSMCHKTAKQYNKKKNMCQVGQYKLDAKGDVMMLTHVRSGHHVELPRFITPHWMIVDNASSEA